MKRPLIAVLAAGLIALGVVADRIVSLSLSQSPTASAKVTTPPNRGINTTTLFSKAPSPATAKVSATSIDQATEHAYAVVSPSVVYVESVGTGSGSGVIYDTQGDIVTNAHVISGASTIKVTLSNGHSYSAQLVGTDTADDLAVIRIHASGLQPATFATANTYRIAQMVLAIGSPLGLKGSVTSGLISGLGRVEQEPSGAYLSNAIQTSAPINPGNSGGALASLSGVVVGMPTLVQTSSQNGETAQNIGFAVPSGRITDMANQIIATGKVRHTDRAYLGISPTDASGQSSDGGFGFGPPGGNTQSVQGALVQQVAPSGPAANAGVQQGDIITSADGTSISSAVDLLTVLAHKKPGDSISLTLNRNGSTLTVHVRLGELPAS
jgi:S1-C subfamily serine protease